MSQLADKFAAIITGQTQRLIWGISPDEHPMWPRPPANAVFEAFQRAIPHVDYGVALHSRPTPATAAVSAPSGTAA